MILGLLTGYRISKYDQLENCAFVKCTRDSMGDSYGEFDGTHLAACHPDFLFFYFFYLFCKTVSYMNTLNCIGFI
jgi:hypothetical protein